MPTPTRLRRRLLRAVTVAAALGGAALVGPAVAPVSAGVAPVIDVSATSEGCTLTIEATVIPADDYVVDVWYDAEVQETFTIGADDGQGTFTFVHVATAPDGYLHVASINLYRAEVPIIVDSVDHTLETCVAASTTTSSSTTSTPVDGTTSTSAGATTSTAVAPTEVTPVAPGATAIPGSPAYTG